jgi:hypothetical protein
MTGKKLAAGWVVQLTLHQLKPDVEPDTRAPTFHKSCRQVDLVTRGEADDFVFASFFVQTFPILC